MKKILFALFSLSAASLAFAGGDACKDTTKTDGKNAKECCSKDDSKCCSDAKDAKTSEIKKETKATDSTEKK